MAAEIGALILAAGKGTRMKSELPKVIHPLLGKPMVLYVVEAAKAVGCGEIALVTGYKGELVQKNLEGLSLRFIKQSPQLGTGHAAQCYVSGTQRLPQNLLVMCADTPLISKATLKSMIALHLAQKPAITMMTLNMQNPLNYGRIIRNEKNEVTAIREAKDCSEKELLIKEVNLAVYLFDSEFLKQNIFNLKSANKQNEFYLTDLIEMAVAQNKRVLTVAEKNEFSTLGINSRVHLAQVEGILQRQIAERLMSEGVGISMPESVLIGPDVEIGKDTVIYPFTSIIGKTQIGSGCAIGPNACVKSSNIGSSCTIGPNTCVKSSNIGSSCTIGPSTCVESSNIASSCTIGPSTCVKSSNIGSGCVLRCCSAENALIPDNYKVLPYTNASGRLKEA